AAVVGARGLQRRSPGGPLVIAMRTHPRSVIAAEVPLGALALGSVLGGALLLIGKLWCCLIPRASGVSGLAILSAVFLGAGLLVFGYGAALFALAHLFGPPLPQTDPLIDDAYVYCFQLAGL